MNPIFWQTLLEADLSWKRSRELCAALEADSLEPLAALRTSRLLTEAERRRFDRSSNHKALALALQMGAQCLEPREFPRTLREIAVPPPVLFILGDPRPLNRPCLGIVGTRSASTYGQAVARKFAQILAEAGATIVSGGAFGIDRAAHDGALEAGGATVAVLGHGIESAYPASHADLFARIRQNGCLVSQFAAGAKPFRHNFPARNHLIAALSDAVLVVEAPERSGALVTASACAEMGRQVFVIPGSIDRFSFQGSHALIRDGATLVSHPNHILEVLGMDFVADGPNAPSGDDLVEALSEEPQTPEQLGLALGLEPQEVLTRLTELELDGTVMRTPTGFAIKP